MTNRLKSAAIVAVVVAVIVFVQRLPLQSLVIEASELFRSAGVFGAFAYALFFIVATLLFVPGFLLLWSAGNLYGYALGPLIALPANVLAAVVAFGVARWLARDRVLTWGRGHPRFAAVDRVVEEQGVKAVVLVRLANAFPFNSLNYAFGLTAISARDYVVGTILGLLPTAIYFGYLGAVVGDYRRALKAGALPILIISTIAAGTVMVLVGRMAKGRLDAMLREHE
jgi:uncharacterized membrane protein YdjX (TVP38/TMEM64 family)